MFFPLYALPELPHSQSIHHDTRSPEQHGGRLLADGGAAQHPSHCHADTASGEGNSESRSLSLSNTTFVHYEALVHKGNVVTVEGGIMHEPKVSALSARSRY